MTSDIPEDDVATSTTTEDANTDADPPTDDAITTTSDTPTAAAPLTLLTLLTPTASIPVPLRPHSARLLAALERFRAHYAPQYPTRIDALLSALLTPVRHAALINTYHPHPPTISGTILPWFPTPVYTAAIFPPPKSGSHYLLDAASLLPVAALAVEPGMKVLDLCAAPGGKSISISQLLEGRGELHVNEPDKGRRGRLKGVVCEYLSTAAPGLEVVVTGDDGTAVKSVRSEFDRVLVDAPCSSSRHVLQAADKAVRSGVAKGIGDLLSWTPKRIQKCAALQRELLATALGRVKVGGRVVYATCSIDETENDGVVKSVVGGAEWKGRAKVVRPKGEESWVGERTKTGWICLPDRGEGWGPLFFAVVKRTA
jgi:hypothetical protein